MTAPQQPDVIVIGSAVIISGNMLTTALRAVALADRTRRLNGMPDSGSNAALAQALRAAMAAGGQSDVPKTPILHRVPQQHPTVTIEEAAHRLGLSRRQTRRLAPRLGGTMIAGRWLLDDDAIAEHIGGQRK
jgi:hypothetical protein